MMPPSRSTLPLVCLDFRAVPGLQDQMPAQWRRPLCNSSASRRALQTIASRLLQWETPSLPVYAHRGVIIHTLPSYSSCSIKHMVPASTQSPTSGLVDPPCSRKATVLSGRGLSTRHSLPTSGILWSSCLVLTMPKIHLIVAQTTGSTTAEVLSTPVSVAAPSLRITQT